jgi:DNA-binding NarL/FixJ family response regulator
MEASVALNLAASGVDRMVMAVVASDEALSERVTEAAKATGVEVVATAADVDALLAQGATLDEITTVVVSTSVPDATRIVERLQEALPERMVVVVASSPNGSRPAVRRLLDCGADGIVLQDQLEAALAGTLTAIQSGQVALPRELMNRGAAPLSFREKQILGLVVMGFTNAAIASKLFLAESTVKSHLSSAFTKLGVHSRHEAAALLADPDQVGLGVLTIARR